MIFVDTNYFMYAVGRAHPLQEPSRSFFAEGVEKGWDLATSAEVLQELLHAYVPVGRMATLDSALRLVDGCVRTVFALEPEDVRFARALAEAHPGLGARDLLHLACCVRREVADVRTHDRALAAVWKGRG